MSFVTILLLFSNLILGSIEHSIIPKMDTLVTCDLTGKINNVQIKEIAAYDIDQRLRIMSFNMLFNLYDDELEPEDRWDKRKHRICEYILWANPDVIGSQELQSDQLKDLMSCLGTKYNYYGKGMKDGCEAGSIPAIFYRKDRLKLVQSKTIYFSETPYHISESPFGGKNGFTFCQFKDLITGQEFIVLNTHLNFSKIEKRYYEACMLRSFLLEKQVQLPLFLTGDFNTFSFRQELDLPFYDGDKIVQIIEEGLVTDSSRTPLYGHFGPICSTNFDAETQKPFISEGQPGIILDHVFVNNQIQVLAHSIDPVKVNGHYLSDHFPVVVDAIICCH